MPSADRDESFSYGGGGGDEVVVVPWPLLLRRRVGRVGARIEGSERYRWWVLWTVMAGLLSVNVTFTIFAVALPRVAGELGTTTNTITWVITGPLLGFGVFAPALGKAGDIWGHRRLYLLGMVGALITAGLSAVAWNAGSLIAVRTLSGIEGAATGAASMALIFRVFSPADRVKAMGFWSLVGAGGPVIGVVLGGPLIEAVGWRAIFAAQVPLIAVAVVLAAVVLRRVEPVEHQARSFDWGGIATLSGAAVAVLVALNRGPEWGWAHPLVVSGFVAGPLMGVAFVAVEKRAAEPLLPLDYLRRRNFAAPIAAQVLANFAYMGGFILAPQLLTDVFGYRESQIALMVIARPLAFSISAPIAGYVTVWMGERAAAVSGTLAVAASMVVFARLGSDSPVILLVLALALSGVGLGVASPAIASSVANAVDEGRLGVASAAQQLMTQVGIVAGIQLMSTIRASSPGQSFSGAYWAGAAVAAAGAVAAALVRSRPKRDRGAPEGPTAEAREERPLRR
jgi:EmrB/QacA subfamily drug resistance transporter